MNYGTKPTLLDKRDYAFHRSFGSIAAPLPLIGYDYDSGKTMPDQNADGLPYGCTGYTLSDIAGSEDDAIYQPKYSYEKTCQIEGHDINQGCDIRNSMKSGQVYGVLRLDEMTDQEAETHRRGSYYNVDLVQGYDFFDSFRVALRKAQKPISVGTPWFPEWEQTNSTGILTSLFVYDGYPEHYGWHNWAMVGEKILDGVPYLICKSWQGKNYGDNGWCYFSRETFNKAFDINGTVGFVQGPYQPSDLLTVKLSLLQVVLLLLARFFGMKVYA